MASKRLRGKVALVTGGGKGIGFEIARALANEGCNLVIGGRNRGQLTEAATQLKKYKVRVLPVACDVRDERAVHALLATLQDNFRRLDILINNAGVAHANLTVDKLPVDAWREVIDTNLTGMFLVTRAALSLMKRGSAILNNLSVSARRVFPGMAGYSAAKHGALGFTKTLREELREKGIRVIALLPGATATDIWDSFWPDAPKKRMISAATVAQAAVNALLLPEDSTVEELVISPTAGAL